MAIGLTMIIYSLEVKLGWLVVLTINVDLAIFQPYISTLKQEITNLWKIKWRGRESNPGPLAPQAKSLTTRPPPLPEVKLSYQEMLTVPVA